MCFFFFLISSLTNFLYKLRESNLHPGEYMAPNICSLLLSRDIFCAQSPSLFLWSLKSILSIGFLFKSPRLYLCAFTLVSALQLLTERNQPVMRKRHNVSMRTNRNDGKMLKIKLDLKPSPNWVNLAFLNVPHQFLLSLNIPSVSLTTDIHDLVPLHSLFIQYHFWGEFPDSVSANVCRNLSSSIIWEKWDND